jgi:protein tyrosine/serine phosphatase
MSRFDLSTSSGRGRAWRDLFLADHGFLRWRFRNRWQITPRMARSNQPSPAHLAEEARRGTKTIINLRGPSDTGFYALACEACARLGLTMVDFRFRSRDVPSPQEALAWKDLLERIEYPALMHCKSGADRAGIAASLYMIFAEGMSVEQAKEQLSFRYLHIRAGKTGVLDFYFEDYLRAQAATGIGFEDWLRQGYDPAEIRARFRASAAGNFLVEKILRRE